MASSLFDFLSFLWPDDPKLSEREAWLMQTYRVLSIVAMPLIPAFGVLYQILPATYVDPWGARIAMAGLFGALLGGSYVSTWIRDTTSRCSGDVSTCSWRGSAR